MSWDMYQHVRNDKSEGNVLTLMQNEAVVFSIRSAANYPGRCLMEIDGQTFPRHEANNSQLKNLAERLLQQDIKDHEGASGSLYYKFSGMKIQNAKLPHASMVAGRLQTRNGAICINGNYSLFYDGILKRTADGDFTLMISDMAVSLEDVRSGRNRGRDGRDSVDHDLLHRLIRNGVCVCKIGKIKAKFQGGSAGLCLFFFRILVKFMRTSLEEQAAQVVKKMLKDEEDMAVIGLIALFAFSEDQLPEEPPRRGIRRYIANCVREPE